MNSTIIVTGGDARYYPLLRSLVDSIRALPEGKGVPVGILDGGLRTEQSREFRREGLHIVKPEWPSSRLRKRAGSREYMLINLNKPFLDRCFPGYKTIIWLDGDTWVQGWQGLHLFRQVAAKNKLAVVTKTSRLRPNVMRMSWRPFGWVRPQGFLYNNARKSRLPRRIRRMLVNKSVLNAGAYALAADAPHWERWRYWQDICLRKGRPFSSDQLSLALTVYEDGLPHEPLPDTCNYIGPWRVDETSGQLLEYFAPYSPVSVVHMIGRNAAAVLDNKPVNAVDSQDRPVSIYLGYREKNNRLCSPE